jgi:organic radical activating enzyme
MKDGKLRYSEAFYSVQGEGKFVGVPSVFLRTFGCNFRCMNFGLPRGEPMRDEKQVQALYTMKKYKGCLIQAYIKIQRSSTTCQ